jgi:ATP-dependent RNA helicase DDX54/DBP10
MESQFAALASKPDIIIATPGRMIHHIMEAKLSLKSVIFCVFDEADRLFEMGFQMQCQTIIKQFSVNRQTCLCSATLPSALAEFTRAGLKDPVVVRLDVESTLSKDLALSFFNVRKAAKLGALLCLLQEVVGRDQQTIVFASTKYHVELLHSVVTAAGYKSTLIYSSLDPAARQINIAKFKKKIANVLVVGAGVCVCARVCVCVCARGRCWSVCVYVLVVCECVMYMIE